MNSRNPNIDDIYRYYEILGVGVRAPAWFIKRRYRQLVKAWHPDRFSNDPTAQATATERMKLINAAYLRIKEAPLRKVASLEMRTRQSRPGDFGPSVTPSVVLDVRWKVFHFVCATLAGTFLVAFYLGEAVDNRWIYAVAYGLVLGVLAARYGTRFWQQIFNLLSWTP
jgi:preprotein translocase subunit Sec63